MIAGLGILLVAIAGGVGAVLRFALTRLGDPEGFPWPVLVANVAGSFVAGLATALLHAEPLLAFVIVTGLCGGLTTFSTFAVETVQLASRRRVRAAIANVVVSVATGVAAAALGLVLGGLAG